MKTWFNAFDADDLLREHPIGEAFAAFAKNISRDELFARQDRLFRRCLNCAWRTGFYRRLWGAEGIEPGDIGGLADLGKLPVFDKSDLMASLQAHPPFGDFGGFELDDADRPPVVMHTTSGTTGRPQVLLFGAKSREVQNLLLGRLYRLQGLQAGDVVHSVYGHGMINGGHYIREAVLHWTNAVFMSAGTGIETPSVRQVELMKDFGATVLVGFADYLKRLAEVAQGEGLAMGKGHPDAPAQRPDGAGGQGVACRLCGAAPSASIGTASATPASSPARALTMTASMSWRMPTAWSYSTSTAATPCPPGGQGDMVCTCLFKDDVYPIIRFNTHDVSMERPGASGLGFNLRRIEGFMGRSDNMVKIKGINFFPQALGPLLDEVPQFLGEYICRVNADGHLTVTVEVRAGDQDLVNEMKALLKRKLGIEVALELASKGDTAALTEIDRRQKPIRLIDERR